MSYQRTVCTYHGCDNWAERYTSRCLQHFDVPVATTPTSHVRPVAYPYVTRDHQRPVYQEERICETCGRRDIFQSATLEGVRELVQRSRHDCTMMQTRRCSCGRPFEVQLHSARVMCATCLIHEQQMNNVSYGQSTGHYSSSALPPPADATEWTCPKCGGDALFCDCYLLARATRRDVTPPSDPNKPRGIRLREEEE